MYCRNCGGENYQDAKFCRYCGMNFAAQEGPAAQEPLPNEPTPYEPAAYEPEVIEPKKPKNKKKWIALAIVAAVILAAATVGKHFYDLRDRYGSRSLYNSYYAEDDGMAFVYNGSVVEEADDYPSFSVSFSGKTATYLENGNLYAFKGEKKKKIDKDVGDYAFAISGKAVAYEKDGKLYQYNYQTKKSEKLAKDLIDFAISFNGKYVAYTTEKGLYIWNGKDSHRLAYGEELDFYIWSVSNDGLVYALNIEDQEHNAGTLYSFTKNGEMTELGSGVEKYDYYVFNRSKSQVIFYKNDAFYVSEEGAEPIKLDIPDEVTSVGIAGAYNCSVKDLQGKLYGAYDYGTSTYTLFRLGEDWETQIILEDMKSLSRSGDNRALYALDPDGVLYEINMRNDEIKEIADDVEQYDPAGWGAVYFTDEDGTLYRNSEKNEIADFVVDFEAKDNGGVLYLDDDGNLYNAGKLGKGREVDDDVKWLSAYGAYYTYTKTNEDEENYYDVYYSKNGGKFKKIRGVYTYY